VCLMLESNATAAQRGAAVRARVRAAVTCEDDSSDRIDDRAARNLAACVRAALSALGGTARDVAMFADLNGESARAHRLGFALTTLADCLIDPAIEHPAVSFGETGAAFPAIATCLAVGSFDRGYARSNAALIVNTDVAGNAACVVIERP